MALTTPVMAKYSQPTSRSGSIELVGKQLSAASTPRLTWEGGFSRPALASAMPAPAREGLGPSTEE
jgi:hypothetical protein